MGFETIKDPLLRSDWIKLVGMAHEVLAGQNIPLRFETFKNDGSYGKAKAGLPGVYFAFCRDAKRVWVELELKARKINGETVSQGGLYAFLKNHAKPASHTPPLRITWNEDDLKSSSRREEGSDMRIKIYLNSMERAAWVSAMLYLAQTFVPLLDTCKPK